MNHCFASRVVKSAAATELAEQLANAFEALIGAIYLEKGYKAADKFIQDNILSKLEGILEAGSWRDPKSHLQEVSQNIDGMTPQYKVIEEIGPDHEKEIFTLGVYVGSELMGTGTGHSKQIALARRC